jgi:hypothetical protein
MEIASAGVYFEQTQEQSRVTNQSTLRLTAKLNLATRNHMWEHKVLHNFQPALTLVAQPPYIGGQKTIGLDRPKPKTQINLSVAQHDLEACLPRGGEI